LPVEGITYIEALAFCQALSKLASINVVLPTEAQWEYACRAGTQTRYYSGDEEADLDKVAWYMGNSRETTHEVGKKKANAWGLYDMLGNVWEPCLDNLPKYGEIEVDNADPVGRVSKFGGHMRGGGWQYPAEDCRAARRQLTNDRFGGMGVRIAINLEKSSENGNPGVEKTPIKTGKD
jgi:formylglycine-generating enzyme required for sulfatase activity